ncbi:MAG: malonic semialdehyde reductase [Alphaproteobacteria bacterium]
MQIDEGAKKLLFTEARTYSAWLDKAVNNEDLKQIYELTKFGSTSVNSCPMRIIFIKSPEQKERLRLYLNEGNIQKTMSAPVTAIIGYDLEFYTKLGYLYPHSDAAKMFEGKEQLIYETALRNSSMQGAYFILAARVVGLDAGPMSGFNREGVDNEFFAGTTIKSNFLCNLGYGDKSSLFPRNPRFNFEEVCKII